MEPGHETCIDVIPMIGTVNARRYYALRMTYKRKFTISGPSTVNIAIGVSD